MSVILLSWWYFKQLFSIRSLFHFKANNADFEEMAWYQALAMYGHHGERVDKDDDDLNLLPLVIEKILIPKLTGRFE